jgi:hypothetical protein
MMTADTVKKIMKNNRMRIQYVPTRQMYGYVGMNDQAAHAMGFPWHKGKHCILVDKNLSPLQKQKTALHETVEEYEMRKNGGHYWPAHRKATMAERLVHIDKKSKPRKFKEYIY